MLNQFWWQKIILQVLQLTEYKGHNMHLGAGEQDGKNSALTAVTTKGPLLMACYNLNKDPFRKQNNMPV